MARSESKRQKRLAKQKARRNEKRQELTRQKSMGLAEQLGRFESAPVLDCLVNEDFVDRGMASILISRKAPSGELAFGVFLVDTYCLGVKDCYGKLIPSSEYRDHVARFSEQGVRSIDPPSARKLIEDAVEFARSLGLAPHPDFRKVRPILNGINPALARETFEMGKDGNAFYIQGPHESAEDVRRIMTALRTHTAPGGHQFMIPVAGADAGDFDELDFEEDEFDDE